MAYGEQFYGYGNKEDFGNSFDEPEDDPTDDGGYKFPNPSNRGIDDFYLELEQGREMTKVDSQELSHLFN
jgi:hypothetical protein